LVHSPILTPARPAGATGATAHDVWMERDGTPAGQVDWMEVARGGWSAGGPGGQAGQSGSDALGDDRGGHPDRYRTGLGDVWLGRDRPGGVPGRGPPCQRQLHEYDLHDP